MMKKFFFRILQYIKLVEIYAVSTQKALDLKFFVVLISIFMTIFCNCYFLVQAWVLFGVFLAEYKCRSVANTSEVNIRSLIVEVFH